ncbi:MAG TPA: response regulator [Lachnospiraceae bacterium]|nr:response regulator [Lachnospiraceae bacterium]
MEITRELLDHLIGVSICVIEPASQRIVYVNQNLLLNAPYALPGKLNPFEMDNVRSITINYENFGEMLLLIPDFSEQMEQITNLLSLAEMENDEGLQGLSEITDEVRTQLTTIAGMTYIAQNRIEDTAKVRRCIHRINQAADSLKRLIDGVADVTGIRTGKSCFCMKPLSLTKLYHKQCLELEQLFHMEHAPISFEMRKVEHDIIVSDEERLAKVFWGVMLYFLEYTPRIGKIEVSLEEIPENDLYSSYVLKISDCNTGRTDGYMEAVLAPLGHLSKREDYSGSEMGIGLLLSKTMVTLLNGSITFQTSGNRGNEVSISIPFVLGEEYVAEPEPNEQGKKLLLVEDNEINAEIAQMILESTGAMIDWAQDGSEAIENLKSSAVSEYDVVLMDINMPIMNGLEATKWIRTCEREDIRELLVIAMTAEEAESEREKFLQHGMDRFVEKPFELAEVTRAFKEARRSRDERKQ